MKQISNYILSVRIPKSCKKQLDLIAKEKQRKTGDLARLVLLDFISREFKSEAKKV